MSIKKLKKVFKNIIECDALSLQLLQIKNSKKTGTIYNAREIDLYPSGAVKDVLDEISKKYLSNDKGLDKMFDRVIEYDGSTDEKTIYKLKSEDTLIVDPYLKFIEAIANPDTEVDPLRFSANAYVIKGDLSIDKKEYSVQLISIKNPIVTLKNKYISFQGAFKEISNKVLSIKTLIDVVVIDNNIYMLTLLGEKLFNMDRAFKKVCNNQIKNIIDTNIISNNDKFSEIASCGHNPRKFVSFNESRLEKLEVIETRKIISKKFNIPLCKDNKFDTSIEDSINKLVKILCNRGMVDPFDNIPMEVSSSKIWE